MRTLVCLLFLFSASVCTAAEDEFSKYPAEPTNFNGHYRIAYWGCGSNCIFWAVINQKTGAVWMAPKNLQSCWPFNKADAPAACVPDWFESKAQSCLFYSYVSTNPDGNATFNRKNVYVWKNGSPHKTNALATQAFFAHPGRFGMPKVYPK